jgi:hypothetical protein
VVVEVVQVVLVALEQIQLLEVAVLVQPQAFQVQA